jgi:hypothetical protein
MRARQSTTTRFHGPRPRAAVTCGAALVATLALVAGSASSADTAAGDAADAACVDALYQLEVLRLGTRVFKPGPGDTRDYLADRDRPAEVQRLEAQSRANCSTEPARRQAQAARASELVVALSPDCAAARERLATMERPNSRTPRSDVERQRAYVAANCPDLTREGVWIADRVNVRIQR